jgi:hypothetical protein
MGQSRMTKQMRAFCMLGFSFYRGEKIVELVEK